MTLAQLWQLRSSPRLRDIAVIGGCSTIGVLVILSTDPPSKIGLARLVCGILEIASLWWRRRFPVAVTLLGFLGNALTGVPFSAYLGLFTVATARRDRFLPPIAALGYSIAVASVTLRTEVHLTTALLSEAFNHGAVIGLGAYSGARRDLIRSLKLRAERAESERELRVEQARLAERNRIAREMHDVLAHKVSLISLHAGGLEMMSTPNESTVQESARVIRLSAHQALEDLRGVLGVLRAENSATTRAHASEDLKPTPGLADLDRIIAESRAAGIKLEVDFHWPEEPPELIGRTAFRVVQEGLTNVHKHARSAATHILVSGHCGASLVVEITNRKPLFTDPDLPGSGLGLVGLAERVRLIGGHLDYGTTQDHGWFIRAELPWPRAEA